MYHVGVDVGGTFTDCALLDDDGSILEEKAFSTPANPAEGIFDALSLIAERSGRALDELLARTSSFVHGCTVATNALIERTGVRTGFLVTRGHEDTLFIGRVSQKKAGLSEREISHTSRLHKAEPPLVDPEFVRGIHERIDRDGSVIVPLRDDDVVAALDGLVAQGAESVAACLLWSFLNPAHERRIRELAAERHPQLFLTLSSEVAPVLGEYERAVTAVLNSYVGPRLSGYLTHLESRLREHGYRGPLLIMQAGGGLTSVREASRKAVLTLDSGPTGGTLGARHLAAAAGARNVICTDVGGTSFDVSLIADGMPQLEAQPIIAQYAFRMPKVEIDSIGSGGGSIAWIDDLGLLHVGPMSAGAMPGPACYGRGGDRPTVTDACLVLGYLNPDNFLGGRVRLDRDAARRALDGLAGPLGMSVEDVAAGVLRILTSQMVDLVRRCTIERGLDPREFLLFAYGGAGPMFASFYAEELGCLGLCVPGQSSVFSAFGMLMSDQVRVAEVSRPLRAPFGAEAAAALNEALRELEASVLAGFHGDGAAGEPPAVRRWAAMRYQMQVHELEVPVGPPDLAEQDLEDLCAAFAQRYAAVYGPASVLPGAGMEIVSLRLEGRRASPAAGRLIGSSNGTRPVDLQPVGRREVYFPEPFGGRFTLASVFDGEAMAPGAAVGGPCVIERMGDAVVVPPGFVAAMDGYRSLLLRKEVGE